MRLLFRSSLLVAIALSFGGVAVGQTSPSAPGRRPAPWKRYCQPNGGFCFKYPSSWTMLGEIFNGNGVVVAPPQKQERALWDAITVALVVPPPEGDEELSGLNGVIEQATSGLRESGQDFQTLQRQQRTIDQKPAQMLKVRYREKASGHEWIEEMVFIEGPENEIYSVALKCSPQNLERLEPALTGVLASWSLPEPAPSAGQTEEQAPGKSVPPEKTAPPQQ